MSFYNGLKETLNEDSNYGVTENGALVYKTTGKNLLDLNFAVASLRNVNEADIISRFNKAYGEDPKYAIIWLFYVRDVRGGLGERKLFRIIFKYLASIKNKYVKDLIPLLSEYGRWDDLFILFNTPYDTQICNLVKEQINDDWDNYQKNKNISLLAKWLPSANATSKESRKLALHLCEKIGLSERKYRKTLSTLRKYLDVIEIKMSANEWENINYSGVPSRANLVYNNAFLRHDENRRRAFLEKVNNGEAKINASALFPHDIVHKYTTSTGWNRRVGSLDEGVEALWKNLPDFVQGNGNTIVVADGSGSMCSQVDKKSSVTALEVANSLAIYFAEHMSGEFKDKYITFSGTPQLVDFINCNSLNDKIRLALEYDECANTDIEAVFDLILKTAINKKMTQKEIPNNILIISDMEFDSATCVFKSRHYCTPDTRLFTVIAHKYEEAGYKLPRLVFWNVNSRTGTIPVKENEAGVALVSGFSPVIAKMVLSNQTDPWLCLKEQLDSERYKAIANVCESVKK